jgi:arylsulfatase A-like enzyme
VPRAPNKRFQGKTELGYRGDSMVEFDWATGEILQTLETLGLSENTIVIYTSDQGFYLGEHGWFDKRFAYNESFKTPLLVKWPEVIKAGTKNSQMVQNLDFAQTILEAAGVTAPSDMQGESLVPLFKGNTANFRDAVYYHYYEYPGYHTVKRHKAVVTEDFKLIHYYYDIDAWELIDRKKDPMELTNEYDNPEYAKTVVELKNKLEELRTKYKDTDALDEKFIEMYKEKGIIPYTGDRF